MSAHNWNSDNCCGNLYSLIFKYFPSLIDKLLLFRGISVGLKGTTMRKTVHVDRVSICHLSFDPFPFVLHLCDCLHTCTCYRLVSSHNQTFDLILPVKRSKRHHHLDGGAVGICYYPVAFFQDMTVYLCYYQRNFLIHAPCRGIIYYDCSVLCKYRSPFL